MEARDHGVLIFPTKKICGLEWIVRAMDAARQFNEKRETDVAFDLTTYYSSEHFPVL